MGSKIIVYIGYAAIIWFLWTNFGGYIRSAGFSARESYNLPGKDIFRG